MSDCRQFSIHPLGGLTIRHAIDYQPQQQVSILARFSLTLITRGVFRYTLLWPKRFYRGSHHPCWRTWPTFTA
ncbi:protein of unknown function [Nitrospira defluvii]|uniref:Uncharacterized protein n=1 Tax=Nitrospira defluvii TaxID=330214 RepID=D8PIM3_9BACT|nr:protein of unknown function [Nitrospira defluvii]